MITVKSQHRLARLLKLRNGLSCLLLRLRMLSFDEIDKQGHLAAEAVQGQGAEAEHLLGPFDLFFDFSCIFGRQWLVFRMPVDFSYKVG